MTPKTGAKEPEEIREWTCSVCRRGCFVRMPKSAPTPKTCGQYECIAVGTWTTERWEGHLRMAEARRAAGVELQPLDLIAFERFERTFTR